GQLLLARMLVGVGESCNAPGTYSMTSDMFPRDKLAKPISVIGIGQVAGSGMALLVGGWLIVWLTGIGPQTFPVVGELKPWQMTFVIVGLPGVLWALLFLATVPEPPRRAAPRPPSAHPVSSRRSVTCGRTDVPLRRCSS